MPLSSDLREFIELLNFHRVEYLIVGAHSLAFHARPRFTGDLDLWIRPTAENGERALAALKQFGFGDMDLAAADFAAPNQIIQLGRAPNRIDLLTAISGVTAESAFSRQISAELDGLPVAFLSKEHLIANKRAVGRPQDIADVNELEG
ncbi:MAG: nucleotidyltransferase [Chthoniobacterales bacterium]